MQTLLQGKSGPAIDNRIGAFHGAALDVPAGTTQVTFNVVLPATEFTDASNTLRLGCEADFGQGFVWQGWLRRPDTDAQGYWTSAPGKPQPSFAYQLPLQRPLQVRPVIETRTQVVVAKVEGLAS